MGLVAELRATRAAVGATAAARGSVALRAALAMAIALSAHRTPPGVADGEAFLHHLDGLADAVAGGDVPLPAAPELPGLPRTAAAVGTLTDAVREIGRA